MEENARAVLATALDESLLFVCIPYAGQDEDTPNAISNFVGPFATRHAADSFVYGYISGSANIEEELPTPFVIDMNELFNAAREKE